MKQLFFLIILLLLSITGSAQKRQVRDAMYDKYGKDNEEKGANWLKSMMDVEMEPSYKFPLMAGMTMTSYKNGEKKDEHHIAYYVNAAENRFAVRAEEWRSKKKNEPMLMIYDHKNNTMIMLNEGDRTGVAMNLNAFVSGEAIRKRDEGKASQKKSDCKKTGKTKVIQGYTCEEYVCVNEDDNTRSEIWISNKLPFDLAKTAGQSVFSGYLKAGKGLGGMIMEGHFYKKDQLEMKLEVTKINPNENFVVKTSDYHFAMR